MLLAQVHKRCRGRRDWPPPPLAIGLLTGRALWSAIPRPRAVHHAHAQLDTLDTNQRLGQARVVRAGASVELTIDTSRPFDARDGFIEVWLINKDGKGMVSVGVLHGSAPETFPITQTLIEQGHIIVDISRAGFDNTPQHSAESGPEDASHLAITVGAAPNRTRVQGPTAPRSELAKWRRRLSWGWTWAGPGLGVRTC